MERYVASRHPADGMVYCPDSRKLPVLLGAAAMKWDAGENRTGSFSASTISRLTPPRLRHQVSGSNSSIAPAGPSPQSRDLHGAMKHLPQTTRMVRAGHDDDGAS
jgi:hypothetical protein